MNLFGGTLTWEHMDEMAARVRPFGWSAIVQLDGRTLPEHEAQLKRLPINYAIDHCGRFMEPVAPDSDRVQDLAAAGRYRALLGQDRRRLMNSRKRVSGLTRMSAG